MRDLVNSKKENGYDARANKEIQKNIGGDTFIFPKCGERDLVIIISCVPNRAQDRRAPDDLPLLLQKASDHS